MLLDGDGFEHYGGDISKMLNGVIAAYGAGVALDATLKRTGTHSVKIPTNGTTSNCGIRRPVPGGAKATLGAAFALYMPELPAQSDWRGFGFKDIDGNDVASFIVTPSGNVKVKRGSGSVLGATIGTSVLPIITANSWNFIEYKIGRSASVGSTAMRVNMQEVDGLMLDGVNTAGGTGNPAQTWVGDYTAGGGAAIAQWNFDDYMAFDGLGDDNNLWVGDQQLFWRPPISDHPTLPQEFVPSTGTDLFSLIDEASPSAADYIRALAANKQAAFGIDALPSDIDTVIGAIPYIFGKKLNAGPCTVNVGLMTNDVIGDALWQATTPDIQLTTVDTFWRAVQERNADTNLPFTPAEVNGSYLIVDRTV